MEHPTQSTKPNRRHSEHPVRGWLRTMHHLQPYRTPRAMWLAAASALILSGVMVVGAIDPHTHQLQTDFHVLFISIANLFTFTMLYIFNFWLLRCGLKMWRLPIFGLLGSLTISTLCSVISQEIEILIYGIHHTSNSYSMNIIINMSAATIAYLISVLLNNVTQHQQTIIENEHLQAENILIRYETLEQQIGPHFLFNSLNTLDGLIGTRDNDAHTYLHKLSDIFRYTMQKQKEVTLANELQFTHSYIYLMQIRHGQALIITERISPNMLTRHVPSISLQLLVENAIKHNVITTRHPLTITIETTPDHHLRVSNPKHPKNETQESNGIGLVNLSHRYSLLFNKEITIIDQPDTFTVELPLI